MSRRDAIEAHYRRNWPGPVERATWSAGPTHELPPDFGILVLSRRPGMKAYGTVCMSQPEDEERLELHVLAPDGGTSNAEVVELLTVVAHFHRTRARLGLGHTVNFGRPWVSGSSCSHGLISLPYLDGPDLEELDEPETRFLWLIPITPEELAFKKRVGLEALEEAFETARFDFLDPARRSVVR